MSKVFGWDVRKGSLYEKELYTLRQNFKEASESKTTIEESPKTEDNVNQDNEVTDNTNDRQNETNTTIQATVATPTVVPPTTTTQPSQFGTYTRRGTRGKFKSSITEIQTSVMNDYSDEMNNIKQQAIADETFMKAPNGNPTNLDERQWLQVRTKAFKNWFGDWTKIIFDKNNKPIIPDDVSKVVDENGEPLVVYHGGSNTSVFDTSGKQRGGAGIKKGDIGTYFTTSERNARKYEDIYAFKTGEMWIAYADQLREEGATEEEIKAIDKEWEELKPVTRAFFLNIRNLKETVYTGDDKKGFTKSSSNIKNSDGQHIVIDSYSYEEYVVKYPNQIKSATNNIGTFSITDNNIRHSSITEHTAKVASISTFTDRLPISQQAKFATMVAQGDVKTSCM